MDRREFLARGGASVALLAFPRAFFPDIPSSQTPPAPLGRIATWWRQAVRTEPSQNADWVASKGRDEVIPLYAAVVGEAPWPTNPVWYQTDGGYVHSGYVQPVEDVPQSEVIAQVDEPGFWAEVCVPFAQARWRPDSPYVAHKLYYETVYRVVQAVENGGGGWWYRLQDGLTWSPGLYVPSWSMRRIAPDHLTPISTGRPDKTIQINIVDQRLTCFEGQHAVFTTRIASGVHGLGTPLGEFRILLQRHTSRMTGGSAGDRYDLPGVPFPVYFTWSGVAIHGTYWHNDYGRRHSHGCVNVTSAAARWIFRWAEPRVPYREHTLRSAQGEGTRVVVI
jgi:lipoprotein-anchoring transpeptidase ErfK/SrfK